MKSALILFLFPALLHAQEFQFQQEYGTIPVEINGWQPFQPWVGGFSESQPAVTDIDADGDWDLFIGNFIGIIMYFKNYGNTMNANYELETYTFASIDVDSRANPCFRDVDGDGDLDLFFSDSYPHVLYYKNTGTPIAPNFTFEDTVIATGPPWCRSPELVDIDADADYDLFGGSYGNVSFFRNTGTSQSYNFVLASGSFAGINVGDRATPEFVDIDADGDYDLFIGAENGKIYYYRNDGDSVNYNYTYVTNYYANIDVGQYASPEFADIDGDGDYDLFVGREQQPVTIDPGDVFYYENIGTPQLARWNLVTKNYLCLDVGYSARSTLTDINADQDFDLFIQNAGDRLSYYENIGTLDSAAYHWVTDSYQDISVSDASPKFCDIDGDQDPDLFLGEATLPNPPYPGLYEYLNIGTPQNASFTFFSSSLVPGNYFVSISPAFADIDADGDQDLFLSNYENYYFFRNVGSPTQPSFQQVTSAWQGVSPGGTASTCFYDLDADGDLDLFCGSLQNWNQLTFYRNVGSAQSAQMVLETRTFLGEGLNHFTGVDVFDIDQDGDGDFLLSTYDGGMVFFRNVTGQSPVDPRKRPVPTYHNIDLVVRPNPGNPASIVFSLPYPQEATLAVYNLLGCKVATLAEGWQAGGEQRFFWETAGKGSGVYILRLETAGQAAVRKVVLLK